VHIHTDILHAIHIEGAPFWKGSSGHSKPYSKWRHGPTISFE
jgi:hypothetical protein